MATPGKLLAALLFAALAATPSHAVGSAGDAPGGSGAAAAGRLAEGEPALAPFAHVLFCKAHPAECRADGRGDLEVVLDKRSLDLLRQVNREVNRAIRLKADKGGPLGDVWSLAPARGDCEDFAITKRHRLIALGWPASALRLTVTRVGSGEGHAVLVVRTDRGDFVLDNRFSQVVPEREARLAYLKIQSGADPQRWLSIADDRVAFDMGEGTRDGAEW